MTSRQFTDLVAIAQAAPGPNVLFVTLIGNHVAGVTGALVATFFMCGPACTVAYFIARVFDRFKEKRWRKAVQAGLVPVSVGLVASTALIITRSADHDLATLAITGGDLRRDLLDADFAALCPGRRHCRRALPGWL